MGGVKESTIKKLGTRKGKVDRRRGNDDLGRERWMGKEGMMTG
jgi:hypothetical protein